MDYKERIITIWNELKVLREVPENYTTQELLEKYASLQERYNALENEKPEGSFKESCDVLIPMIQEIHYMSVFFGNTDFKDLLKRYSEGD